MGLVNIIMTLQTKHLNKQHHNGSSDKNYYSQHQKLIKTLNCWIIFLSCNGKCVTKDLVVKNCFSRILRCFIHDLGAQMSCRLTSCGDEKFEFFALTLSTIAVHEG